MSRTKSTSEERVAAYLKNGQYQVPYSHHPQEIKDALRRIRLRPQMKQCFANCQRFFVDAYWLDLEYHEGYIVTAGYPMAHAWLVWNGQIIDLTLGHDDDDADIEYQESYTYTRAEVRAHAAETGMWSIMNERELWKLDPFRKAWEEEQRKKRDSLK